MRTTKLDQYYERDTKLRQGRLWLSLTEPIVNKLTKVGDQVGEEEEEARVVTYPRSD